MGVMANQSWTCRKPSKGRRVTPAFLRSFVEEVKASGFVADALKRSGQVGALVAPAAP